ncbi:hypothetical protein [Kribbella sp. NPDC023855]|uniref:effector-associated constant component EACC1 n=1 Tax=Kribbella sp. NPDC023855 TaxID=3154698 RepID=UPI00340CF725
MGDDVRWVEIFVLGDDEFDAERVDRLARQLRSEFAEREFDTRPVAADAPGNSKGDAAVAGAIAVAVAGLGAGGMIPTLIAVLRDWLARRTGPERISVKVGDDSIELDRPSFSEREQLLQLFLAKHAEQ